MKEETIKCLRQIARRNEQYRTAEEEFLELERSFQRIIAELTDVQQDVIWAFVFASDQLDRLLLETACDYIDMERL